MTAIHASAAKANAPPQAAPPAILQSLQKSAFVPAPLASLSAIPAMPVVQRKCAPCDDEKSKVQPRLEVGPVGDRYEVEADTIAAQVMAMRDPSVGAGDASAAGGAVQRACSACSSSRDEPRARRLSGDPEEDEFKVRASRDGGPETIAASDSELTGGGAPLPSSTRSFFEGRMGRDLSDVRVHQGGGALAFNDSISARAFTYKNHVWLGAGESAGPSFTMAHELAHVMQQTAPGPVGPRRREAVEASEAGGEVQRRESPFWLPGVTTGAMALHTSMHDAALKDIRKNNPKILTEVPIPGANRTLIDVGERGRADIYTADGDPDIMVPGVQQVAAAAIATPPTPGDGGAANPPAAAPPVTASIAELDNFTQTMMTSPMEQGSSTVVHESRRAPKIEKGRLTAISSAPKNIFIGEMKPAHDMDYRRSGVKQIANYIGGISAVAAKANAVAAAMGENADWKANPKVIGTTPTIPPGWDASKPHTDWDRKDLKIRYYAPDKAKTGATKGKPKAQNAHQGRPKTQPIRGRWMMAPDNETGHEGVFVYFLAPNPKDLANALKPSSTRAKFRGLAAKIKKIQQDLITAPKPVNGAVVQPLRIGQPVKPPPVATAKPPVIVRKEVKDNFKAATWEAERTGAGLAKGATDTSLLADYGGAADNDLREEIADQGSMVEWLKTKPKTPGTTYEDKTEHKELSEDLSRLKSADFWTSLKARPFGILREKFGLFFVKAYEKVATFGKSVRDKFKGVSEGKILAGKSGTIMKAAAKVASVVLPRLVKPFLAKMLDTIIDCGIKGFEAKFRELIQGTIIEDIIQTAEDMKDKVDTMATDVEGFFKDVVNKTIEPIATEFEDFVNTAKLVLDVVHIVKEITTAIRIGSCVAGLASAPATVGIGAVVGCGAALGDYILSKFGLSPVDHLIGSILSSCEMQNRLGKAMAGLAFVKTLPARAGVAVITQVKSLLAGSQTLKDMGTVKGKDFAQHASELFCTPVDKDFPEMGYEDTDCSDTGDYRQSKTGKYDIPGTVPLYEKQDPIPASEKPWQNTEIPIGREGDLAPLPTPGAPPQAPAAPAQPVSPPATQGGAAPVEPKDSVREGNLVGATPSKINMAIHGGFNPKIAYDGTQMSGAYVIGTGSDGAVYGPVQVTIYIISLTPQNPGWIIKYRFKVAKPTDNIVLTDGKTGTSIEIYDSATGVFTSPVRGEMAKPSTDEKKK